MPVRDILETPFEPNDLVDSWGTYSNGLSDGSFTAYGRVYLLEFDPVNEKTIQQTLSTVTDQWQQVKDVAFSTGESTNSQGKRQIKIELRAGSFITFEHCDSAIRDTAILHMRQAVLKPITTWFLQTQERLQNQRSATQAT